MRQDIYIASGDADHGFKILQTFADAAPTYENQVCDLVANPGLAEHFTSDSK